MKTPGEEYADLVEEDKEVEYHYNNQKFIMIDLFWLWGLIKKYILRR